MNQIERPTRYGTIAYDEEARTVTTKILRDGTPGERSAFSKEVARLKDRIESQDDEAAPTKCDPGFIPGQWTWGCVSAGNTAVHRRSQWIMSEAWAREQAWIASLIAEKKRLANKVRRAA